MRADWLRAIRHAIGRNDHRNILPAGNNPLLVLSNNLPWSYLFAPVLAGALLSTAFACLWHRSVRGGRWPRRRL
jgi:hypothetical protein